YRQAIAEDSSDRQAHDALVEAYQASRAWEPLYEELTRALDGAEGEEQKALILRMAEVAETSGRPDRAAAHYREILKSEGTVLSEGVLDAIERVAIDEASPELIRDVLERRVTLAQTPRDEAMWLERLGELYRQRFDDASSAVDCFRRAGRLLDAAADQTE